MCGKPPEPSDITQKDDAPATPLSLSQRESAKKAYLCAQRKGNPPEPDSLAANKHITKKSTKASSKFAARRGRVGRDLD